LMEEACCTPATNLAQSLHEELATLLSQYDINAAAASVKVYAIKPKAASSAPCCGPSCCA
jgi:arsenite methyltransferase